MKVVAHPLVVAVALGLLSPTALAREEDGAERDCSECIEELDTAENEHFAVDGDASQLPKTVYLTLE